MNVSKQRILADISSSRICILQATYTPKHVKLFDITIQTGVIDRQRI